MSRLINADEVEKVLRDYADDVGCNRGEYELANGILKAVGKLSDVPTAYDVDKVVEELDCNSRFIDDINEHNIKCISCVIGQKTAIDIVKRGGIE